MTDPIVKRVFLTQSMLSRGGPTLLGLTIANALDEVIAEARGKGGGIVLDPLSIAVSTSRIDAFGEPSLGVEVSINSHPVIEVVR